MTDNTSTILVTGCARSGTTWLGRVLAAPPDVRYVHEPFNFKNPFPGCAFRSRFSYEQLTSDDHRLNDLEKTFCSRGRLLSIKMERLKLKRLLRSWGEELVRKKTASTVVKDPIAFLSAETLAERFDIRVAVITRRPETVIASHLGRGWDFRNLSTYVETMRSRNIWTDAQLDATLECEDSPVDRLAHLWRLLALWTMQLKERHPDWVFVRYEDAAMNPKEVFPGLCERLGVTYSGHREDFLEAMNRPSKRRRGKEAISDVARSRSRLPDPDRILEPDQDERVKAICERELDMLYPERSRTGA